MGRRYISEENGREDMSGECRLQPIAVVPKFCFQNEGKRETSLRELGGLKDFVPFGFPFSLFVSVAVFGLQQFKPVLKKNRRGKWSERRNGRSCS